MTAARRIACGLCRARITLRYAPEVNEQMATRRRCFMCMFWEDQIRDDAERPDTVAIVDGRHYVVGPEPDADRRRNPIMLGFGGSRHVIEFNDGRVVETRNLWTQGEIPERFRDRLADNATFRMVIR